MANNEYTNNLTKLDLDLTNLPSHVDMNIQVNNGAAEISSSSGLAAYYVVFFNHHILKSYQGRRECRAVNDSSVAKKICVSVTGNNREYTSDTYNFWIF